MAAKIHNTMGFRASPDCLDQCAQDIAAYLMQGTPAPTEPRLHGEVPTLKVYSSIIAKNSSFGDHENGLLRDAQFGSGSGYNIWGDLTSSCASAITSTDIEGGWRDEDALKLDLITLDSAQGAAFAAQYPYPDYTILTSYYQDGSLSLRPEPTDAGAWEEKL